MRIVYLDYNATTPIAPSVQEYMHPFLAEHFGNPSSHHALGRACQEAMEDSRGQVASLLGADPDEIIFTSGGTESNNLSLQGVLGRYRGTKEGHLVISSIEHPAVMEPAQHLQKLGYDLSVVPCSEQGMVDPMAVADALQPHTVLVSIMHANNEVGTIQPIRQIAQLCRERGIWIHTDAAQSTGKIPVRVDELNVDLLSVAGHKFYAPKGIGALYVRRGTPLEPILHGAGHEEGLRPGTENVPYIVGLGRAASLAEKGLDENATRMAGLRDRLCEQLHAAIGDEMTVNGADGPRLPNTLSVNFAGVDGYRLLARIPELCASTGAACHGDTGTISQTLAAMEVPAERARGMVRLSVGWQTSQEEIDLAAGWLIDAWQYLC